MKKTAGYSMLFGAALLCVILMNADRVKAAQDGRQGKTWSEEKTIHTEYSSSWSEKETLNGEVIRDESGSKSGSSDSRDANSGSELSKGNLTPLAKEDPKVDEPQNNDEDAKGNEPEGDNKSSEVDPSELDESKKVPDSVGMNLAVPTGEFPPANFRGGDPDDELVHCLEDTYYKKQEHTLIYADDINELTENEDAYYSSEPNMKWTLKDAEGNVLEETNTNIATNGGTFQVPGEYTIGNSGARQVSETKQDETTETTETTKKTVTAQQESGVIVHDVTSPDIWVGLAELNGDEKDSDVSNAKKDLVNNMKARIVSSEAEQKTKNIQKSMKSEDEPDDEANAAKDAADAAAGLQKEEFKNELEKISQGHQSGRAYTQAEMRAADNDKDCWLNNKSFLFIDEGITAKDNTNERNLKPTTKTARITTTGSMFNEDGGNGYTSVRTMAQLLDKKDYTWLVQLNPADTKSEYVVDESRGEDKVDGSAQMREKVPGLFVKRNVPFYFAAVATDNGDRRATAKEVEVLLYDEKRNEIKPEKNGSYMFKTANYPRADFPEQSVCTLFARATDADGNTTEFALPVYVLDSQSSYSLEAIK